MNILESFENFLPNISITESPGALVFPSRRLWDDLRSDRSSLLFSGPWYAKAPEVIEALLRICLIGGIELIPEENKMKGCLETEWQWSYKGLGWNPADYDGVQQLSVPSDEIWTPYVMWTYSPSLVRSRRTDVVLESRNTSTENSLEVRSSINDYCGSWSCKESALPYPFDTLECEIASTIGGRTFFEKFRFLKQSGCGDKRSQRRRHGDFDLVGQELQYYGESRGFVYTLKFARNPSRVITTVVRPSACLTLLNAFSYRVQRGRVSFCCLLMISSTIVSMSFFRGIHARTNRIPQIAVLIFCSTLWIFFGLVLAIFFESFPGTGRKLRRCGGFSKWMLLGPSALLFLWLMIQ